MKIPAQIPQALMACGQDPGWDKSSFVASQLKIPVGIGIARVGGFVVRIPGWDTSSFVASQSRSRLAYLKISGFAVKIPDWVQDPGQSSLWLHAHAGPRLGHLKFCGIAVKIPVGIPQLLWIRPVAYLKFVLSQSRSRFGLLTFCGFAVKIPAQIPQALWLRGQDPGWRCLEFCGFAVKILVGVYLEFVASRSRSRLGYLKFVFCVFKIPVDIPQVCGVAVKIPVGDTSKFARLRGQDPGWDYLKFGGFALKIPVGIPQDPGWDTSSLWASWSGSRSGYLKFCGFAVKIQGRIPQVLWLRGQDSGWDTSSLWLHAHAGPRLGHLKFCGIAGQDPARDTSSFVALRSRSRLTYLKFVACGFVVRIPVGDTSSLWLRCQDPGWHTSSFVASQVRISVDIPQVCCGFAVKIPVGKISGCMPQILWLRSKHPGRDTSSLVASAVKIPVGIYTSSLCLRASGARLGYLKFCGFAVKIPVGNLKFVVPQMLGASRSRSRLACLKFCGYAVKIPVGINQGLWLRSQKSRWGSSSFWLRGQDPGWDTSTKPQNLRYPNGGLGCEAKKA